MDKGSQMDRQSSRSATNRKPPAKTRRKTKNLSSRGVLREVEPGSSVECVHCGERVKFQAKMRHKQVICNVYDVGVWKRVEHFHPDCYDTAGEPHGSVDVGRTSRVQERMALREAG